MLWARFDLLRQFKKGHVCFSKSICDKTTQYSLALKKYFGYQKFKTYPKRQNTEITSDIKFGKLKLLERSVL